MAGRSRNIIGDAIFAVFGLLNTAPDDATKALTCAHRMLEALGIWNRERELHGQPPLAIGIGINYGPAVVGDVGSKQGLSFTVIGDTVNTASRLQSLTRELGVSLVVGDALVVAIAGESHSQSRQLLEDLQDLRGANAEGTERANTDLVSAISSPDGHQGGVDQYLGRKRRTLDFGFQSSSSTRL